MKKLILSLFVMSAVGYSAYGQNFSASIQVQPNTITNVLANSVPTNGSFVVTSIIITANGSTNVTCSFIDTPNGVVTNLVAAYGSSGSYVTNYNTTWTNFNNVIQTNPVPIIALIDYTNTVAAVTNARPVVLTASALTGASTLVNNQPYVFQQGIFVTNGALAGGTAIVTVSYRPR